MPVLRQHNYQRYIRPWLFATMDYLAILLAECIALTLTTDIENHISNVYTINKFYQLLWIPLTFVFFNMTARIYHMRPVLEGMERSFKAILYGILTSLLFLYFGHSHVLFSGWLVAAFIISVFTLSTLMRFSLWKILKTHHILYEPVILIGAGKTAERAIRFYENDLGYRYDVLGIIDDNPISAKLASQYKMLGNTEEAGEIIKNSGVKTVIITAPGMTKEKLQKVINDVQPYARNISFVPDLIGTPMAGVEAHVFYTEQMAVLKLHNNLARLRNRIFKRCFDLFFGIIIMVLLLPILAVIAVIIKKDSKGPAFHNALRIGHNGELFTCYKFRSMYENSDEILNDYLSNNPEAKEEWTKFQKLKGDDPRVTKAGKWIRKYSLDELPQIFNVVLGNMSFVGPRPYLPREKDIMGEYLHDIKQTVPGITGLWQVSGRNDVTFEDRLKMDTWYVRNWSIWADIHLLYKTIGVVIFGRGAY